MATLTTSDELPTTTMASIGVMPMDVLISFDTTGSMSSYLAEVRSKMSALIERLFTDLPTLRIGIIAHGDYCDKSSYYVTKHEKFTNDVASLVKFVEEVGSTGGGDWEECYELVLHEARTQFDWVKGEANRALIMIGDAIPHEPNYSLNSKKINWRNEILSLYDDLSVKIYAVQCGKNDSATSFYKKMADVTGGKHLDLTNLDSIVDMLMAICYREKGAEMFDAFESEVREREGAALKADLDDMLKNLRDKDNDVDSPTKNGLFKKASSIKLKKAATILKSKSKITIGKKKTTSLSLRKATKPKTAKGKAITTAKRKLSFDHHDLPSDHNKDDSSIDDTKLPSAKRLKKSKDAVNKIIKKNHNNSTGVKVKPAPTTTTKNMNGKLFREKAPNNHSPINGLKFGNWRLAMSNTKECKKLNAYKWKTLERNVHIRPQIYSAFPPSVYEIAVQSVGETKQIVGCILDKNGGGGCIIKNGSKKIKNNKVVICDWKNVLFEKNEGSNGLFESMAVKSVKNGRKIYVRRSPFSTRNLRWAGRNGANLFAKLKKEFDYAWVKPMRCI